MPEYRLYCLTEAGHISLADEIEAQTDEDAVLQAQKRHPDAARCEVWEKNRLVAKLNRDGRFEKPENNSG